MEYDSLDLKSFNESCDGLLNGKYILAEYKISSILKSIAENQKLKNLITTCVCDYNFNEAFDESIGENDIITLPDDAKGIIAYCFSLLYNIDNKLINFYDFLSQYFEYNDISSLESYKTFARTIILPFKEAINTVYERTYILVETNDYQNNIYNRLKQVSNLSLKQINDFGLKDINKEELECLLTSMIESCTKSDKSMVYALLIAFDYFSMVNKKAKVIFERLKECFEN